MYSGTTPHPRDSLNPPPKGLLMAINAENYADTPFWEIHGIQKVYIVDYEGMKVELEALEVELAAASELYKSGQTASIPALKKVKALIRKKLELKGRLERTLEDINGLGAILDERDGTVSTARTAS